MNLHCAQVTSSLPLLDEETRLQKPQFKPILFRTVTADGAMLEAYHRAVERWEQRHRCQSIRRPNVMAHVPVLHGCLRS